MELLIGMLMIALGRLGAATLALRKHLFEKVRMSERWPIHKARSEYLSGQPC